MNIKNFHFSDPELLKKKWINLRKKFTRLRNERSQTNKSTLSLSEQTSEQWPIYDKFEELFGRFIHSRRYNFTNFKFSPKGYEV